MIVGHPRICSVGVVKGQGVLMKRLGRGSRETDQGIYKGSDRVRVIEGDLILHRRRYTGGTEVTTEKEVMPEVSKRSIVRPSSHYVLNVLKVLPSTGAKSRMINSKKV